MVNEKFLPEAVREIQIDSMVKTLASAESIGTIPALTDKGRLALAKHMVGLGKTVNDAFEEARTNPNWKNIGRSQGFLARVKKFFGK